MLFPPLMPEGYNHNLIVPASPDARRDAMRMTTPSFRDDADAERHLLRHLRRRLLVCYDQDTGSEHTITEEHIADAFAHHERFRRSLDLQGINPDTLIACTDEGKTMVRSIIKGWVWALRLPLVESER